MFLKKIFTSIFNMNYINDMIDLMEKGMLNDTHDFIEDNTHLYTIVIVE
jgi:hypothetical protein